MRLHSEPCLIVTSLIMPNPLCKKSKKSSGQALSPHHSKSPSMIVDGCCRACREWSSAFLRCQDESTHTKFLVTRLLNSEAKDSRRSSHPYDRSSPSCRRLLCHVLCSKNAILRMTLLLGCVSVDLQTKQCNTPGVGPSGSKPRRVSQGEPINQRR